MLVNTTHHRLGKSRYQDPLSSPYPRTPLSSHPNKHTNTIQDVASTSSQFQCPQSPLVSSSSTSQIVTMLQQQQSVLQKVLDGQKNLEERQNTIEAQQLDMQANIERSSSLCSSGESGSDGKRKRTVTRALSVSINFNLNVLIPSLHASFTILNRRKCIQCTMQVIYSLNLMNRKY